MKQDEANCNSEPTLDADGTKRWYRSNTNLLHRLGGGPAVENSGYQAWGENGKRHRLDGPAVVDTLGRREWWVNGEKHHLDGPAIEYSNGTKHWYKNGKLHRLDGPAVEYASGKREWGVEGVTLEGVDLETYLKASNATTFPGVLSELSRHKNRIIAQAASHNPNCPLEAQIEWALTRGEEVGAL